jgi:hypothetical protein
MDKWPWLGDDNTVLESVQRDGFNNHNNNYTKSIEDEGII